MYGEFTNNSNNLHDQNYYSFKSFMDSDQMISESFSRKGYGVENPIGDLDNNSLNNYKLKKKKKENNQTSEYFKNSSKLVFDNDLNSKGNNNDENNNQQEFRPFSIFETVLKNSGDEFSHIKINNIPHQSKRNFLGNSQVRKPSIIGKEITKEFKDEQVLITNNMNINNHLSSLKPKRGTFSYPKASSSPKPMPNIVSTKNLVGEIADTNKYKIEFNINNNYFPPSKKNDSTILNLEKYKQTSVDNLLKKSENDKGSRTSLSTNRFDPNKFKIPLKNDSTKSLENILKDEKIDIGLNKNGIISPGCSNFNESDRNSIEFISPQSEKLNNNLKSNQKTGIQSKLSIPSSNTNINNLSLTSEKSIPNNKFPFSKKINDDKNNNSMQNSACFIQYNLNEEQRRMEIELNKISQLIRQNSIQNESCETKKHVMIKNDSSKLNESHNVLKTNDQNQRSKYGSFYSNKTLKFLTPSKSVKSIPTANVLNENSNENLNFLSFLITPRILQVVQNEVRTPYMFKLYPSINVIQYYGFEYYVLEYQAILNNQEKGEIDFLSVNHCSLIGENNFIIAFNKDNSLKAESVLEVEAVDLADKYVNALNYISQLIKCKVYAFNNKNK